MARPAARQNEFITGVHSSVSDRVAQQTADRRRRRRGATNMLTSARYLSHCWRLTGSQ